jgi:hypothetical protein
MAPNFSAHEVLRSHSLNELSYTLSQLALEFAIFGQVATACSLISLLNTYFPLHPYSTFLKPLWFLWDISGEWPVGEEEKFKKTEEEHGEGIQYLEEMYERGGWRQMGFLKQETAGLMTWEIEKRGKEEEEQGLKIEYDAETMKRCMAEWRHWNVPLEGREWDNRDYGNATTGWNAMKKSALVVKILELALVSGESGWQNEGESEKFPSVDDCLGMIAERLHANSQISYLAQSGKAWSILKDGALTRKMGVKEEETEELGKQALETFRKRFEEGPQKSDVTGNGIKELIDLITSNTISNPGAKQHWDEMGKESYPTTLIRQPLSHTDIIALEDRLKTSLPADFKEFLSITNGLEQSFNGWHMDPPLHPASEIHWLGDDPSHYMTEILSTMPAELLDINIFSVDKDLDYNDAPAIKRVIEIGTEDIFNIWLLPADAVERARQLCERTREKGGELRKCVDDGIRDFCGGLEEWEKLEWCVVAWTSGSGPELRAWPSFRAYLEYKAIVATENHLKDL